MLSFMKVVERASTGPVCSERDFDLRIFVPNLRKVVKEYGIRYDPQSPVPADDDLADRVWAAGLDFVCETGVFCPDTERRILFSREEIEAALAEGPRGIVFGAGTDAKAMPYRRPEDETPPWCSVGAGGSPVSNEANLLSLVKGYAENPLGDSITTPGLTMVDGQMVTAGCPTEIEGAIRTMVLSREALRRAGRLDMPIVNAVASAVKAAGHIAGHRYGIRKSDALEIGTHAEMKVDFDSLNKIALSLSTGSLVFAENGVILGGMAGGPAGTAVVTAAYNPIDILVLRGAVQHPFPTHFDLGTTSTRDTIWARSLANQAVSRNSRLPLVNIGYAGAGPTTKMVLYEFSAWVIGAVVSGGSIEVGGSAHGTTVDHTSPMEPLLASEVAHAVAGMSRKEANKIVLGLLEKYEDKLHDAPLGKRYQECFDVAAATPSKEFLQLYREVRQEMEDQFGLHLPNACPYS
jgi:methylamine--corrinoid protein Co-methyltransferase